MEVFNNDDSEGKILKKKRNLTKWNDALFIHLYDISTCFVDNAFDRTKQKSISMKWDELELLRDALVDLAPNVKQMATELISYFIFLKISMYLLILNRSFSP